MLGVALGMLWHFGWQVATGLLLLLAFLLFIASVTYQFRAWLGAMMINERRRRAIIAGLTLAIILLSQSPYLLNLTTFRKLEKESDKIEQETRAARQLANQQFDDGTITQEELDLELSKIKTFKQDRKKARTEQIASMLRPFAIALPPLWPALAFEKPFKNPAACGIGWACQPCACADYWPCPG